MDVSNLQISKDFPNVRSEVLKDMARNLPYLPGLKDKGRFLAISAEEVGNSFEPRLRVIYEVYSGQIYEWSRESGSYLGNYEQTFIFEKNLDFAGVIDSHWVKRLQEN